MVLAYFILAVAVLVGILAGVNIWSRTRDVQRTVVVGLVATLATAMLGAAIALVTMIIWPPAELTPVP